MDHPSPPFCSYRRVFCIALALVIGKTGLLRAEESYSTMPDHGAPDHWAADMRAFAEQDRQSPFPQGGVVFVGSSSIRLWDLAKSFPQIEPAPLNRGFGGSQLADSNRHLELLVLKHQPRVVVLYAGDNDISAGKSAQRVAEDFQEFQRRIVKALPETRVLYIAIKPSLARWRLAPEMQEANRLIRKACEADDRLTFVDVWTPLLGADGKPRPELFQEDGLHLNAEGYRVWSKLITGLLRPTAETPGAASASAEAAHRAG